MQSYLIAVQTQFRNSKMISISFRHIWTITQFYNTQSYQISLCTWLSNFINDLCLGFYIFLTEVVSMISQSKPAIYQTELSISETEAILFYNDNFTLAISIVIDIQSPLQELIDISTSISLNVRDQERKIKILEKYMLIQDKYSLQQQDVHNYPQNHQQKEYFFIIRMGGIQQINREYLKNNPLVKKTLTSQILQGQVTSNTFRYIFIQFTACQNISSSESCATQKEIENILESGHYYVYKSDYLIKLDHLRQPYQEIITNEFNIFSLSTSKTISQKYKILQTSTDEGLIWEQIQDQSNIQQSEWREISEFYNNQYLIAHYIRLDYKQTNNIRTFVQLQTILGKLGGILQILIIIIAIVLRPVIQSLMKLEMVNNLFNFSESFSTQSSNKQNQQLVISNQINN